MSRQRRKSRRGGAVSVSLIVIVFLIVMSVQIVQLKNKETAYAKEKEQAQQELDDEQTRSEEIQDLYQYMKSDEYIEDVAKSKLGLAYPNEIIFKEKKAE